MNEQRRIRILLADDHPATCQGIAHILSTAPDFELVGVVHSGLAAQQKVAELQPDILLLDLIMPDVKPYEVEEWVRIHQPEIITLILTGHQREYFLAQAVETQVAGFLTKDIHAEQLLVAIRRAANGEYLFTAEQLTCAAHWRERAGNLWESLTEREKVVMSWLGKGLENEEIANIMGIEVKTVKNHLWRGIKKLGLESRSAAMMWIMTNIPEAWREDCCKLAEK
jgi:DNA-binding NarL/FixJ family response regulator